MITETPTASDDTGTLPAALLGESQAAHRLRADLAAASRASRVLLEAEPGLDAVDVGRQLHVMSSRRGPFVVIECAASEPESIERELFGTERADGELETVVPGAALARARGGTLFLADVSDLSAPAQARLGRVVRDGEARLAATGAAVLLDLCLIAHTSSDAVGETQEGRLRRELLRQFARTRVVVPPLRQRREDLPVMVRQLVTEACDHAGVARKEVAPAAMTLLAALPWAHNLAGMRETIARTVIHSSASTVLLEDALHGLRLNDSLGGQAPLHPLRIARREFERDYIAKALQHHRGRIADAARTLGIQRTNLYRKARQLGLSVTRPTRRS